jgi:hypothetical protein
VYINLDMIGHPWTAEELRKLVLEGNPENGEAYLAQVKPADFAEPGYAQWRPELAPLLAQLPDDQWAMLGQIHQTLTLLQAPAAPSPDPQVPGLQ